MSRRSGGARPAWRRPAGAARRALRRGRGAPLGAPGQRARVPVICIGNLTVGGAGKTPTAIAVARMLSGGRREACPAQPRLWRRAPGPVRVDPARHRAADVGDEPLLLARVAPTIVARDRVKGAAAAVAAGASVIVMDDGFQNPSLDQGFLGAGAWMRGAASATAGSFRRARCARPLEAQLGRAARAARGRLAGGRRPVVAKARAARHAGIPRAARTGRGRASPRSARTRVLAFAGIGDPDKFFATLAAAGVAVAATRGFPTIIAIRGAEARALLRGRRARRASILVTTEKDLARMQRRGRAGRARRARARAAGDAGVRRCGVVHGRCCAPKDRIRARRPEARRLISALTRSGKCRCSTASGDE